MAKKKSKSSSSKTPEPAPPQPIDQDDSELLDELLAHLDSKETSKESKVEAANVIQDVEKAHSPPAEEADSNKKSGSKAKFEARKAAAQAANFTVDDKEHTERLEREARDEEKTIQKLCDSLGVQVYEINPDGHCLFSAIADQLGVLGILTPEQANFRTTRLAASNYIFQHPDDFVPFLPSVDGEDGVGATDAGLITPAAFERYCVQVRDTAVWGGQPEILALSRAFNVPIHVIQHGKPPVVVIEPSENGGPTDDKRVVRISYHRRMYGLGEHYNSLRPKSGLVKQVKDFLS
ncbi:cysteine proteinase [Schizopora paradoxa]|uniref:Cysteine proteinase n=1 Tax=Schizopora paradoxa TaxID=27342 RepID=A0A0H2R832_9AGAM|nr:cysteine proteinase [Schizopora paradoxa]